MLSLNINRKFFDRALDLTTRSWFAFAWNAVAGGAYLVWNIESPHRFDPYPFMLLCLIWTGISYYQNLIILAMQRENEVSQQRQEELQKKHLLYMLHLMEAIHAYIKGSPFVERVEAHQVTGSGIPGDQ